MRDAGRGLRGKLTFPTAFSDESGIDWPELFRGWIEQHGWTLRQCGEEAGIPQLFAVFADGGTADDGSIADDGGAVESQDRGSQLDAINRFRARHGKPPIQPREQD